MRGIIANRNKHPLHTPSDIVEEGMNISGLYDNKEISLTVKEKKPDDLFICEITAFETVSVEYKELKLHDLVEITRDKISWIKK